MKKLLSCLLAACLLAGFAPASLAAPADGIASRPLRVLCIGHSFAVNAMEELYSVAHAEGLETVLGLAYYSGCTLEQHVNFAKNDSAVYVYYKWDGTPKVVKTSNSTVLHCIEDEPWDIIILQTGSSASTDPKTYRPDLDTLMSYVDAHKKNPAAKYVWNTCWAYQEGFPYASFSLADQRKMIDDIIAATQKVIAPMSEFTAIIPTGVAIQNARTSLFGDHLCRDGQHVNDMGKLIAAYTWYCALTGKTLTELKYPRVGSRDLTEIEHKIVLESVNNALLHPFELTTSRYAPNATAHWSWTASGEAKTDEAALAGSAVRAVSERTVYTAEGPVTAPVCTASGAFELAGLAPLEVAACGAANVSLTRAYPADAPAGARGELRVYVSLDGKTYLPDPARVRSATLLGGGAEGLSFRLETEDLRTLPGVTAGSVIRKIKVVPDAADGAVDLRSLAVNTYTSAEGFALAVPEGSDAVQAVAAPLTAGGELLDGVRLAACAEEGIATCTVVLYDATFEINRFSRAVPGDGATGVTFESAELNDKLADLSDGEYRLDVTLAMGEGSTTCSFDLSKGLIAPCMGNHAGRKALTWEYLQTLTVSKPAGHGSAYRLPAGDYYLPADLVVDRSLVVPNKTHVTICLNGHTLRGALAADSAKNSYYYNYFLPVYGQLDICDHAGGGRIVVNRDREAAAAYTPYVMLVQNSLVNFYSGAICDSNVRAGAINCTGSMGGVFNMYGGRIEGNRNVNPDNSGGVFRLTDHAELNLYGGEITGNGAAGARGAKGAAVVTIKEDASAPTINVYGGRIAGNKALCAAVLVNAGGTLNMSGGEISGNVSSRYGAVYLNGTKDAPVLFNLTGGTIGDNICAATAEEYGRGGGITLGDYATLDFSGGTVSGNKAMSGGGVFLNSATACLEATYGAVIENNTATSPLGLGGGGVAAVGGTVNLSGGVIRANTAQRRGGGVSVLDGDVTAVNVTVCDNTLTDRGGMGGGLFLGSTDPDTAVSPKLTIEQGAYRSTTLASAGASAGAALCLAHGTGKMLGGAIAGAAAAAPALELLNGATFTLTGGEIAGGTGVTVAGDGSGFTMTGGTVGGKDACGFVTFRGDSGTVSGEFTGGTVYLPVRTMGRASFEVALRNGDFAGVAAAHRGVTAYGGRFAASAYVAAVAAPAAEVVPSADPYFKFTLRKRPVR